MAAILQAHGYQKFGFETMYNGMTGRKMDALIYLGPAYYQRLRHMVDDKIFSRARGRYMPRGLLACSFIPIAWPTSSASPRQVVREAVACASEKWSAIV